MAILGCSRGNRGVFGGVIRGFPYCSLDAEEETGSGEKSFGGCMDTGPEAKSMFFDSGEFVRIFLRGSIGLGEKFRRSLDPLPPYPILFDNLHDPLVLP